LLTSVVQRQGREIEEFRKELEKSKDKHQRKVSVQLCDPLIAPDGKGDG
jgi:hypothetical protein